MTDIKCSQRSAGAERADPRAIAASSREAKRKTDQDEKLIKILFEVDPLDWARYPDGSLAFIHPDGSKSTYTQEQLDTIQAKQKPSSTPKSTPKPKASKMPDKTTTAAARSPLQEQRTEILTRSQRQAAKGGYTNNKAQEEAGAPPASAANAAAAASED